MALNKISSTALKSVKAKGEAPGGKKRLDDGGGLYLLLVKNKKDGYPWRFDYTFEGKRKTLSLGWYESTSLQLAREKAVKARELLASGIDPSDARKETRTVQQTQIETSKRESSGLPLVDSFEFVALEWFDAKIKPLSASHSSRTWAYLTNDLIPYLGKLPIDDIKAPALLECLRRIASRQNKQGKPVTETANRVREQMGQLWRYAIATGRAERDIAADLRGALEAHVQKNFSHITDPKQLGQLLRDIDAYQGTPTVKAAMRLLPFVFTRPGEFRAAKWENIDLDAKEWRYVATKTDVDHIVPLSEQAVRLMREIVPLTGNGEYVFGVRGGLRPLSENTINQALKSLGYTSDMIQPHGFRHTAATMLAELGWNTEAIDRQLAHKQQGVKGVYQKAQYLEERRRMMQAWADYLDGLKSGASIIPFRAA